MPTIAGFYASHQDCREWLKTYNPESYHRSHKIGASPAKAAAERMMKKRTKHRVFEGELITPLGSSSDPYDIRPCDLMLVRRYSPRKEYIAPSQTGFDVNGKALIKRHLGLNVSDWKVVWYDEHDRALQTFVLEPKPEGSVCDCTTRTGISHMAAFAFLPASRRDENSRG
ncbi:hypothetical protein FRC10_010913 [Ceratobasidium sp. 414]|nr:hypothetical protein FRC10_010913 [Ceratobasidium sp. 414]